MARPVQRRWPLMTTVGPRAIAAARLPPRTGSAERHGRVDGGRRSAFQGRAWAYALAVGSVIASPEDGDVVQSPSVQVVGTAPAGAEIVQQIPLFGDRRTSADDKGDWVLTVDLEEGNNDLVFRIGDEQATTKTLRIVYEPES